MGGRVTEAGRLGAFITKVKKGSLADVVGHLRAGSLNIHTVKLFVSHIPVSRQTDPHVAVWFTLEEKQTSFTTSNQTNATRAPLFTVYASSSALLF